MQRPFPRSALRNAWSALTVWQMRMAAIRSLSRRFHDGIVDEGGRPYLEFVRRVVERVVELGGDQHDRAAALLVGVIEHAYATPAGLLALGVPPAVVRRVDAVDGRLVESVDQHLARLRQCPGAVLVKRAETLEWLRSEPRDRWRRQKWLTLLAALDAEQLGPAGDAGSLAALDGEATDGGWYAAELLGRVRAPEAVAPLADGIQRMGAGDQRVELRSHFVRAIARIMTGSPAAWWWSRGPAPAPDPAWRPTLEGWLNHPHADLRQLGAILLGRLREPGQVNRLVHVLSDTDDDVAAAAAIALGLAAPLSPVSERLQEVLSDEKATPIRRAAAAHALGELMDRSAAPELVHALRHPHGRLRMDAARALTRIAEPAVVPALREVVRGSSAGASSAAWVLGEMRTAAGVPDLLDGLTRHEREHYLLWDRCAEALGKIGSAEAVHGLVAAYHAGRAPARAIWALGRIGADHAIDTVLAASHHTDPDLRATGVRALATATDPRAVPRLAELCDGPHAPLAVRGLVRTADPRAIPALARVVATTSDRSTRRLAGRALAQLRPRWTQLSGLLYPSQDVKIRRIQAWLFGYLLGLDDNLPDSRDLPVQALAGLLADRDQLVRARAAASLGRRRAASATDTLQRALSDVAPRVRASAATALGQIGDPASRRALTESASDPHKDVRAAATAALRRLQ
jgi:HEAT repeat protein